MKRRPYLFILVFMVVWIFPPCDLAAEDDIFEVGLIGQWNNYGNLRAVKVWEDEERSRKYAFCATSKGIVSYNITTNSVASFIPLGECHDLEIYDCIYVTRGESGLYIINAHNPERPYYMAQCDTPGFAAGLAVTEEYAYIADGKGGLQIIDVSNKERPQAIGSCDTVDNAEDVAVVGNYAYVVDGNGGVLIIDVRNKSGANIIGKSVTLDYAHAIAIEDDYIYAAIGEGGLQIIDIANKNKPAPRGFFDTPGFAQDLAIEDDYAYIADGKCGLQIIDITDKNEPEMTGGFALFGFASSVFLDDEYAYVAERNGNLCIINIRTKNGPEIIGSYNTPNLALDVAIEGDYAYVADGGCGLQIIDIKNKDKPDLIGTYDILFGAAYGLDIADGYVYIADGYNGSLQIIDISKKSEPRKVGSCKTHVDIRDVSIAGDYAYIADGYDHSLRIIDISKKSEPRIVGSYDTLGEAWDVTAVGTYLYVADGISGIHIIDISTIHEPALLGTCNTPGNAQSMAIEGNYAYVADGGGGLQIVDISNKYEPAIVGSYTMLGFFALGISVAGDYAYVADGLSGVHIINIRDKDSPIPVGSCGTPGSALAIAVEGDYAYIADWNYGVHIIDIHSKEGPRSEQCFYATGSVAAVAISGEYAYMADEYMGVQIIHTSNKNGPRPVGICTTPGLARDVAIADDYAYVADWESGLQIIDIGNKEGPVAIGNCSTPGYANSVTIAGNYAYMADGDLQIIDITNKREPEIVGTCDTPGARYVTVKDDCAYVVNAYDEFNKSYSLLQIIDISNKEEPQIIGNCDTPGYALDVSVVGDYAYVADLDEGLQIIDIHAKNLPRIVGSCATPGRAQRVCIVGDYAYVADLESGLQIINIRSKDAPRIIGSWDSPSTAEDVVVAGDFVYVADRQNGLLKLKLEKGSSLKGNLILVAGGGASPENSLWPATQAQANHVYKTFINNGYEAYDIWYQNPFPFQDIDNDGIINQLVVDDSTPTKEEFLDTLYNWQVGTSHAGPLYICLIGHGAEDRFQIMPDEVIAAQDLSPLIQRPTIIIMESGASGSFIDDLIKEGKPISVITSTRDGPSYIKPDFSELPLPYGSPTPPGHQPSSYLSFTSAFIEALSSRFDPEQAFISARNMLMSWTLEGFPFSNQAPQMVHTGSGLISLSFSEDGENPIEQLTIDSHSPLYLTILGKDTSGDYSPFIFPCAFFSSGPDIIDPSDLESFTISFDSQGVPWYMIKPKKNGYLNLTGYPDPYDTGLLISAILELQIFIDDPAYSADNKKQAVIIAGYQGSGDYLWESTNTIANHAYRTLRAMGYGKREIYYYNPYLLQDLDGEGDYDDIDGYPHLKVLDPEWPYSAFSTIRQRGTDELLLFFVDHGKQGSFRINPTEALSSTTLAGWISEIATGIDTIIFLYDACYSGSFLHELGKSNASDENLADKLITITSTDSNQTAYYLNKGMVSFSYPFFNEWFLTHSLMDAFDYAKGFLPREGQTPLASDPDRIMSLDQKSIYYIDESKPVIYDSAISRSEGELEIKCRVYALTGINRVWSVIETIHQAQSDRKGRAITEAPQISLSLTSDPNYPYGGVYTLTTKDPCPGETSYNITIYAQDKSRRPKMAFQKISMGDRSENRTIALICESAPHLFSFDEADRVSRQVARTEAILKGKGLKEEQIRRIGSRSDLVIPDSAEGQIFLLYLIGMVKRDNDGPHFYFSADERISPYELDRILDPNRNLLLLTDTPYAGTFLSAFRWQEKRNWAGLAGSDQEKLFFPIGEEQRLFPCFSNFFFSGILSGGTVAQAFRIAHNAVSLTRQMPELFLSDYGDTSPRDYQTINRHLNYYLGTAAIPGEEYSLLGACSAQIVDENICLSLIAHPDAQINKAWVALSSLSPLLSRDSIIIDLIKDEMDPSLYYADIPSIPQYYQAYFMVEGQTEDESEAGRNWTEWQKVSIVRPVTVTGADAFEPDNDPNCLLSNPACEIIVNALPARHTFSSEHDMDWIYFYAFKDLIYEIYAQDLSEYGYFVQLSLYDPNIRPLYDQGRALRANNYCTFTPKENGYCLLEVTCASSYPSEGVEYILSVSEPQAGEFTSLLAQVKDPLGRIISMRGHINGNYVYPDNYRLMDSDSYCYKFNSLPPYNKITLEIYEGDDFKGAPVADPTLWLSAKSLNFVFVDLTHTSLGKPLHPGAIEDTSYQDIIGKYRDEWELHKIPFTVLPYADEDLNFPTDGDFDGDGLSNLDEVLFYSSSPLYPTVSLSLHKGMNLFFMPSIVEMPNIVHKSHISYQVYSYDRASGIWGDQSVLNFMESHTFNAIYSHGPGMLYLDLKELTCPILHLIGFLDPTSPHTLPQGLFDPDHFTSNLSAFEILADPELSHIKTLSTCDPQDGTWGSNYRFFGSPAGEKIRLTPYEVYDLTK